MSFAKLTLGYQWGADEWPECVEVDHNGGRGDGPRRYVPESTCRVVRGGEPSATGVPRERRCSECYCRLTRFGDYCPGCGARVVGCDDA